MTICDKLKTPLPMDELGLWPNSDAWRVPDWIVYELSRSDTLTITAGSEGEILALDHTGGEVPLIDAMGLVYGDNDSDEPASERIPEQFFKEASDHLSALILRDQTGQA